MPPQSGTFLAWCFLMCVALVVELALLNFEIVEHENQHKYSVLGRCWLRCLPRGGVVADNLKLRIPNIMSQKAGNYTGLIELFFSNQAQAIPESHTDTHAPRSPEVPMGSQQAWFATSNFRIFCFAYLLQFKCN